VISDQYKDLYSYLLKNKKIIDITNVKKEWLYINSVNVLKMIRNGITGWEKMVPNYVENEIKEKGLFGFKKREERGEKRE
jgi:hypothetical protein